MNKPPQHRADATIEFIRLRDPAWDFERINDEIEVHGDEHPVIRYHQGLSRYDLDAPVRLGEVVTTAREYLLPEPAPVVWTLRRLRAGQVARCVDIGGVQGQQIAFMAAFVSVSGLDVRLPTKLTTDQHLQQVADAIGLDLVWEVGRAALEASKGPTSAEKKA